MTNFRPCKVQEVPERPRIAENAWKVSFLAHARRTGCRIGDKIVSMPRPRAPENVQKCLLFATFLLKHAHRKAEVSPWGTKMSALKLHLSSGSAENELPELRIEHEVCSRVSKNAWKRMVFATFLKKQTRKSKFGLSPKQSKNRENVWKCRVFGTFRGAEAPKWARSSRT